jgi:hypothetical protein
MGKGFLSGVKAISCGRQFRQHDQVGTFLYCLLQALANGERVRFQIVEADLRIELDHGDAHGALAFDRRARFRSLGSCCCHSSLSPFMVLL